MHFYLQRIGDGLMKSILLQGHHLLLELTRLLPLTSLCLYTAGEITILQSSKMKGTNVPYSYVVLNHGKKKHRGIQAPPLAWWNHWFSPNDAYSIN
jgi:hypothetical protein